VSGFYQMHRGWQDADIFGNAEYSERDAWVWLIEAACWQPKTVRIKGTKITLERGQMTFAVRFMSDKWGWSKSRVDRFLKRLSAENMISTCSKIGTTAGHAAGQGQSIITVCNYEKYQTVERAWRDNVQMQTGTTAGQQRDKEEEGKKERKEDVVVDAREPADDLIELNALANAAARAAGVRHIDPSQIILHGTLVRQWVEAGADPPLILDTIREDRVRDDAPTVSSLKYFEPAIRRAIAKREALQNGQPLAPRQPGRDRPPAGRAGAALRLLAEVRAQNADKPRDYGTAG
jgi:hypothetical protein